MTPLSTRSSSASAPAPVSRSAENSIRMKSMGPCTSPVAMSGSPSRGRPFADRRAPMGRSDEGVAPGTAPGLPLSGRAGGTSSPVPGEPVHGGHGGPASPGFEGSHDQAQRERATSAGDREYHAPSLTAVPPS